MRGAGRAVLHPGRAHRPLRPSETGRPIPYLDEVALDFPELTIVAGHIGYPWTEEMIPPARALADLPALDLDTETRNLFLAENAVRVFHLKR